MNTINRQYIEDHDVVARYLADQLSDAERESFEAYFLEHPEVVDELNRAARFKSGLIDLKESGALERLLKQRTWRQRAPTFAIAASIALIAIGTTFWFYSQTQSRPLLAASIHALSHRFQSTLPIAASYRIERTRTSSYDASIQIPKHAAAIELRVKPEVTANPARYRVTLSAVTSDGSTAKQLQLSGLAPDSDGFVPVYLNASALSPAVYELRIAGEPDTSAANHSSSFLVELTSSSD